MAVYSVSQVTFYLKEALESDPALADLWVLGEVSNLRTSPAGHAYFTLKDGQAVLNCVMFRGQRGQELLDNGAALSAHGRVTFYEPRGATNFMVDVAMPEGVGELALEFERLKVRLEAEGLFEESRKRPLPYFPQVVGLVTSPAGSVFHDIQNVLRRRYPLVELLLSPTSVQGDGAAPAIAAAVDALDRQGRCDVIIVARGGGSLEELWPFNEEAVARSIYASRTPVVSGVGHETDITISDLVADLRAPTPSAAAELVTPDGAALLQDVLERGRRCRWAVDHQVAQHYQQVSDLARRLDRGMPDLEAWKRRVDDLAHTMHTALSSRVRLALVEVGGLEHRLRALDPEATLRRGFSVVQQDSSGQVVSCAAQVSEGDALTITVSDGQVPATAGKKGKSGTARRKSRQPSDGKAMDRLL